MTKPVTSVAILMLVEDGKIRLDDPLHKYLPEFADAQVHEEKLPIAAPNRAITIRDLLTHTSGIAYGLNPPEQLKKQFADAKLADGLNPEDPTLADNIKKLAIIPLAHQPGSAWLYGMNTDVLGRVVEVASGKSFDQFLADRLFTPLKMTDTGFRVPQDKASRLVALYTPGEDKKVKPIPDETFKSGITTVSATRSVADTKYRSGGAGLCSTSADYARFLQMLLNEGELDGVRVLTRESVKEMTRNQIGKIDCAYAVHGNKFGLGVAVQTVPGGTMSIGVYGWGGMYHTLFWVDPQRKLTAIVMTQVWPWGDSKLWPDIVKAVNATVSDKPLSAELAPPVPDYARPRFVRQFWFEMDAEHGNPKTNGKFRVNDNAAALHPEWGKRPETKGNGMMQIQQDEPLADILGAELALELWGGHPYTAGKRVTVNGHTTYRIPEIGTAAGNCTHQYPVIRVERSDLVQAHNVFQFGCDRGDSFWGHFIIESAALRVELGAKHKTIADAKLTDFTAKPTAKADGESFTLGVDVPAEWTDRIASVDYFTRYDGFDENGDGRTADWHGMVKKRQPYGHTGTATTAPFQVKWDVAMLPAQTDMAVRAVVKFKDRPDVIYETAAVGGLTTPERKHEVRRVKPVEVPKSFWSRDNKKKSCDFNIDFDPEAIESAEVCVVVWDGGVEKIDAPLTWNDQSLGFKSDAKHDTKYLRLPLDPKLLKKGKNTFAVFSDTTHHGIEILLPGPELWVKTKTGRKIGATPDDLRRVAMNTNGDAKKGKELFFSAGLRCTVCHKVQGQGGEAGPDLTLVAGKYDKTHLIESILDPSAQILEGFRTTRVDLNDGTSLLGMVSGESTKGFTLTDAEGKKHAVTVADVERRTTDTKSLMPADVCAPLSTSEFTDLVAYLGTLRTGRALNPGEGVTGAVELPKMLSISPVSTGFDAATTMDIAPDGRIFVCEQTGALRVVKDGRLLAEPFVKLPVASTWERGLIGVAVAPDFAKSSHIYVLYVAEKPFIHHVLSRFTAKGDTAEPGSEKVLFEGDDQSKLGGHKPDGHQGGPLRFGPDGKLYVAIGEQTSDKSAQRLDSLLGKILRLNPDGTIPDDNPFVKQTEGKYRAIWALGCRNPFGLAFQPKTGRLFYNDVGGKAEEVNEVVAGANYGWPTNDHGPTSDAKFRGPLHHYPTACITGGVFSPDDLPWPKEYRGKYFYADFNHGFIRMLDPAKPEQATGFATGLRRPTDLRFAANGDLYVLLRDAWVIDKQHKAGTGSLLRIRHPATSGGITVSETKLFDEIDCYRIDTPTGSYVYGKKGAGFASIYDADGRDWISYAPGDKAKGEYRGLPKSGQPTKYFHCGYGYGQYKTENIFTSTITLQTDKHVRIHSETKDGKTACTWDFHTDHATLTIEKFALPTYWFLYEGTPGGKLESDKDFVFRPDGTKTTLDKPWSQVVPWVCFGASETPVGLMCINHQKPEEGQTDSYVSWPFEKGTDGQFHEMTVFGFGRKGYKELVKHVADLKTLPAKFSIGFIKNAEHKEAATFAEGLLRAPARK
jgi:putative heme-binding domain-containing protein